MKEQILQAIYESFNNSLIRFDDNEINFTKGSKINSTSSKIIANMIVDDCIENESMTIEQYNQIVKDAYYPVTDNDQLKKLCELVIKSIGNECDLNWIDTSQITDMSYLFGDTPEFNGKIDEWNVSNVKSMYGAFVNCHNFNQDISGWDVSNVQNMAYMFGYCRNFNQDISRWDVSNVIYINHMFYGCERFNQDISNWNVDKVEYFDYMFDECGIDKKYIGRFC